MLLSLSLLLPVIHVNAAELNGTVTVDASSLDGSVFRTEQYLNGSGNLDTDEMDKLNEINTSYVRTFIGMADWFPSGSGLTDPVPIKDLSGISAFSDNLSIVLKGLPSWLRTSGNPEKANDWLDYEQMVYLVVSAYKQAYPNIALIECNNEPDGNGLDVVAYNQLFRHCSKAITQVNNELSGTDIKIAGPVLAAASWSTNDQDYFKTFLDFVRDNHVAIDYVSWHEYNQNPSVINAHENDMRTWLSNRGLGNVKIYLSEYNYKDKDIFTQDPTADYLALYAAYQAAMHYSFNQGTNIDMVAKFTTVYNKKNAGYNEFGHKWQGSASNAQYQTYSFPALQARYVKIESFDDYNSGNEPLGLNEFQVLKTSTGLPATLTSSAAATIDNNLGTYKKFPYFYKDGVQYPVDRSIVYDMGASENVDQVKISFYQGGSVTYRFSILTSTDGIHWERVIGQSYPLPSYNERKMLSMLRGQRVSATSNQYNSSNGRGLNAFATKDNTDGSMAILVWNYQDDEYNDHYHTTLNISNLPSQLRGAVRMEEYLVNSLYSNYANGDDLNNANLKKVTDKVVDVNATSFSASFHAGVNSVRLIVLTPAAASAVKGNWKFDETSGATASDSSIYGNTGTVNGASWTAGSSGNALLFDGVNDNVTVPDSHALDFTDQIKIDVNINFTSGAGTVTQKILIKDSDSTPGYVLQVNDTGKIGLRWAGSWINSNTLTWNNNQWYHIVVTHNGSTVTFQRDGVSVGSIANTQNTSTSNDQLIIGSGRAGFEDWFKGKIDELSVSLP
jgi:hypothetical protein